MKRRARVGAALTALGIFAVGLLSGSAAPTVVSAAATLFEYNRASLAGQLAKAGAPPITAPFGIAEQVPDDGTRHFTLTVGNENRESPEDTVALYALADGHGPIVGVWGANVLAFAHADMTSGAVHGLEVDVGNLGTSTTVPVAGINVFAIGTKRSDVAIGILNELAAGPPGGFREGIAFHSNAPGTAVSEVLMRVHPGFGEVTNGIDLREARFAELALATPGFSVDGGGWITSTPLALGRTGYACVDADGRLFASVAPCVGR
jgi:hypothetical protein